MKETKKNLNNNMHVYGYINDIRINPTDGGRTAINMDIATIESYKKDGEQQYNRSYHDATLFTDDKNLVKKFEKVAADVRENRENRGVEDYKGKSHTVSLDGILVNRENKFKDSDKTYTTVAILVNEKSVDLDAKLAEGERRNRADFKANVSDIKVYEDKKFAVVRVANNYHPEEGEDRSTWIDVRVNGNSRYAKGAYEAIAAGKVQKGDFVRIGGQLRDNTFETSAGMKYGNAVDLTSFEKIERKESKDVKEAPAKKAAEKAAETKKATSKKAAATKEQAKPKAAPKKRTGRSL